MKKLRISIRLFAIVTILLLCILVPTLAATGKSSGTVVRVRKEPSTSSDIIELLNEGDNVNILGTEGDWYKVSAKGVTGYVSKSYITVDGDNVTNEQNNNTNDTIVVDNTNNNTDNVNTTNNENSNTENNNTENNNTVDNSVNNTVDNSSNNNESNVEVVTTKVYKMAENTKLNILPVITSEYIGEVKKDESVTLVINAGLWAYIKTENVSGWVRIGKLSAEEVTVTTSNENANVNNNDNTTNSNNNENTNNNEVNNNETNPSNEQPTSNETTTSNEASNQNYTPKTMYAGVTAINVRSASNTESNVVNSIGLNTEVKVIGEENGWYKVEVNGLTGYIRSDLLSNEKKEVTSRNNDLDRTKVQKSTEAKQQTQAQTANNTAKTTTANTASTTQSVPVSSTGVTGNDIVAYAKQFVGCRYVYGAAGPNSFDCSGLTMYVYKHFGYSLSHSSKVQATQGVAVKGDLQPGDILVFSNDGRTVGHVGIYIGNDKFIHASDSTTGVIISNLSDKWNISKYWGARRIL